MLRDQPSSHVSSRKHWSLSSPPLVWAGQHRSGLVGEHSSKNCLRTLRNIINILLTCTGKLSALMRKLGVLTLNWWTSFMVDIVVLTTETSLSPEREMLWCSSLSNILVGLAHSHDDAIDRITIRNYIFDIQSWYNYTHSYWITQSLTGLTENVDPRTAGTSPGPPPCPSCSGWSAPCQPPPPPASWRWW